jgi:hypothetical protein
VSEKYRTYYGPIFREQEGQTTETGETTEVTGERKEFAWELSHLPRAPSRRRGFIRLC